jgi:ribosomal protein L37E
MVTPDIKLNKHTIICDRCNKEYTVLSSDIGTCGYYNVYNTIWSKYKLNEKEMSVCDDCMSKDLNYRKDYLLDL